MIEICTKLTRATLLADLIEEEMLKSNNDIEATPMGHETQKRLEILCQMLDEMPHTVCDHNAEIYRQTKVFRGNIHLCQYGFHVDEKAGAIQYIKKIGFGIANTEDDADAPDIREFELNYDLSAYWFTPQDGCDCKYVAELTARVTNRQNIMLIAYVSGDTVFKLQWANESCW